MTKAEFREWLQAQLTESHCREEQGDVWRKIESEGLLPDEVRVAADHVGHSFIFGLSDGLLASSFEFGVEGETVWFFVDDDVNTNLRECPVAEAEAAVEAMQNAATELERLLPETAEAIPTKWVAAAAYGDKDYGEGHSRLFTRVYNHEPTGDEVRQDAFVEAVPDWEQRYPRYTLHAAAYEWDGTLTDALTISIIPAAAAVSPPTIPAVSSPADEA